MRAARARRRPVSDALAVAIARRDWERVAACLLRGAGEALLNANQGTIDDLIAFLAEEDEHAAAKT